MTTKDHEPENDGWSVREVHDLGDDPLNHDGDGTIREGDPMYDLMMRMAESGKPMMANRREDGLWEVSMSGDGEAPVARLSSDEPPASRRDGLTIGVVVFLILALVALTFTYLLTR